MFPLPGDGAKHALGVGHHQGRRDTLPETSPMTMPVVVQAEEVVEVAPHLFCGLVVVGYLQLQFGQVLGEQGVLDAPPSPVPARPSSRSLRSLLAASRSSL